MTVMKFETKQLAQAEASKMIGWKIKIVETLSGWVIKCNEYKYLMSDGFVK